MPAITVAALLIWAWDACGCAWGPGGCRTIAGPPPGPLPGPLPHGTLLTTVAISDDAFSMLKLQTTSLGWSAAQLSSPARDRLAGTVTPLKTSRVGAAKEHTAQTTVKPAATKGTMMASPAGIRARYSAKRERPVTTRWRNIPSVRSAEPAVTPSVAATMKPKTYSTPATSAV